MTYEKSFLISLDYGDRENERLFVADILNNFDRNTLIGAAIYVNNNIYHLSCHLFLNFEEDAEKFEGWLVQNYPNKQRIYNLFNDDFLQAMVNKGCNSTTLLDAEMLEHQMSSRPNEIFIFADRKIANEIFPPIIKNMTESTVFLSHSSEDKPKVEHVFNELQKRELPTWFDRYEIKPGDSITEKINSGLANSKLGLLFISKHFLDSKSGWPMSEANYFFQKRMKDPTVKFIVINIDIPHDSLPPLLQDYLYIDFNSDNAIEEIVNSVKHC